MSEAIILAGGLGTRLRSAVPDLPKCMAPVNGRPFIGYVIDYFLQKGVSKFILSLGYKSEAVIEYIKKDYPVLQVQYAIEDEPLGTGGAIKLACTKATEKDVFVTNGDTFFAVDLKKLLEQHTHTAAACTLSLKPMHNFDRYGVVELNENQSIASFKEKQHYDKGLINGGLYVLKVAAFLSEAMPQKFSFEKSYMEALYLERKMFGQVQDAYFIDIGIPQDYLQAQEDFKKIV
ncbi:nucleotidyltransferase family protein [Parasediminibacterium sp. JCM 36343]|uniref:nucleotidyltransferase family protein n=1 Tax=Parasediminibacterium sp. JCM 36343 TaxID=3374279 RepID=UPI00397B96CE